MAEKVVLALDQNDTLSPEQAHNLARAALNLGWYQEAEREFFDLLSQTPDDAFAHAALGLCYASAGQSWFDRQTELLDAEGVLILEYDPVLNTTTHPQLVLEDCQVIFLLQSLELTRWEVPL